jgi:hypothetical protein
MDTTQITSKGGYEELNPLWTKSKKNNQPKTILTTSPQKGGLVDSFYNANPNNFVFDNANKYINYGITPNKVAPNLDKELAEAQSNFAKTFNSLGQALVSETILGTIKAVADLFDAITNGIFQSDGDYQNPISNKLQEWQDYFRNEVAPIYSDPERNDIYNGGLTNWGWWTSNAPSVMSSLTLLLPATGIMKGAGAIGKALKLGARSRSGLKSLFGINKTLDNIERGVEGAQLSGFQSAAAKIINSTREGGKLNTFANVGGNAVLQRMIENYQEAQGVYQDIYKDATDKLNRMNNQDYQAFVNKNQELLQDVDTSDRNAVARKISKASADEDFKYNFGNLTFDIIQMYGLRGFWKGLKDRGGAYSLNQTLRNNKLAIGKTEEEIKAAADKVSAWTKARNKVWDRIKNEKLIVAGELSEGAEEAVNYIAQMEGTNLGKVLLDEADADKSPWDDRMKKYLRSGGLADSAFWGVMGGVVFHHLGSTFGKIQATIDEKNKTKKDDKTGESTPSSFGLSETGEVKARRDNMQSWLNTFNTFFDRAAKIKEGINPFAGLNEKADIKGNTTAQEIAKSRAQDELITDLTLNAAHHGNAGYLREFMKSNEVRNALVNKGITTKEDATQTQQEILNKMNEVTQQYNNELTRVINIADNYAAHRKDDQVIPIEYLQMIATNNVKYGQDIARQEDKLNLTQSNINVALQVKEIADKLGDTSIDDLQRVAAQTILANNLAELYAQRREIEESAKTDISQAVALDNINKNIAAVQAQLTPDYLREAIRTGITAFHDENGVLKFKPNEGASKELKDIMSLDLTDAEGNEDATKRADYFKRLDEYATKHNIIGELSKYSDELSIAEQNKAFEDNRRKANQVLTAADEFGIPGVVGKNFTDLLVDKAIAEVNRDYLKSKQVKNREDIASELSFLNQTLDDARVKVVNQSFDTVKDIAKRNKDNRDAIINAVGAYYNQDFENYDNFVSVLNDKDKADLKESLDALHLSGNLNYRFGEQIQEMLAKDDLFEDTKPAATQVQEEEAEQLNSATPTSTEASPTVEPLNPSLSAPQIGQTNNLSDSSLESVTAQGNTQLSNVGTQQTTAKPSKIGKLNFTNNKFIASTGNETSSDDYQLIPTQNNDEYEVHPISNDSIASLTTSEDLFANANIATQDNVGITSYPIVRLTGNDFEVVSQGKLGIEDVKEEETLQQASSTGGLEQIKLPESPEAAESTPEIEETTPEVEEPKVPDFMGNASDTKVIRDVIAELKTTPDLDLDAKAKSILDDYVAKGYSETETKKQIDSAFRRIRKRQEKLMNKESTVASVYFSSFDQEERNAKSKNGKAVVFDDSYKKAVSDLLDVYAKDAELPQINGKYYGNLMNLMDYIKSAYDDYSMADFMFNSLSAYLNTPEGQAKFNITDANDVSNPVAFLNNFHKSQAERDAALPNGTVHKVNMNLSDFGTDEDMKESYAEQVKLKNGDKLTIERVTTSKGTSRLGIKSNGKLVGSISIPSIGERGEYVQKNDGLIYNVDKADGSKDGALKQVLKDIARSKTPEHEKLNEIIHKAAFDKFNAEQLVNEFKNNPIVQDMVKNNMINSDENGPEYEVALNGLAKLWRYNYKVLTEGGVNKFTGAVIANSIDKWFDTLRESYNETSKLDNNPNIDIVASDVFEGELIRSNDGTFKNDTETSQPIQLAIAKDTKFEIAAKSTTGEFINGIGSNKFLVSVGRTYVTVPRNNGTVDIVNAYPVSWTGATYYTKNGKQQHVEIGKDFKQLQNAIIIQIKDRLASLNDGDFSENRDNFIDFIDNLLNINKNPIFLSKELSVFRTANILGINFGNKNNQLLFYRDKNGDGVGQIINKINGKPNYISYNSDLSAVSDKLIEGIKSLNFNINFAVLKSDNNHKIPLQGITSRTTDGKFQITIPEYKGKNGVNLTYDSFKDFIQQNNLLRVNMAQENGSNIRRTAINKQGANARFSFQVTNKQESRPVEDVGDSYISKADEIKSIVTSDSTDKGFEVASALLLDDTSKEKLNSIKSDSPLRKLLAKDIIFDEEFMSKHHAQANAVWSKTKGGKVVIGQIFLDMINSKKPGEKGRAIRTLMHENLHAYIEEMADDKLHPNAVANLRSRMQDIYDDFATAINQDINDLKAGNIDEIKQRRHIQDKATLEKISEWLNNVNTFTAESYATRENPQDALEEFIVESLTNVDLINYLNQVDADGGAVKGNTIWQKILKFIGDLFGINIRPNSLRAKQMETLGEIFKNNQEAEVKAEEKEEEVTQPTTSSTGRIEEVEPEIVADNTNSVIDSDDVGSANETFDIKDEDVDADDEYDADESTSEEVAFNSFNSAIESLPMSERAKFASLVSSAAISMSCK